MHAEIVTDAIEMAEAYARKLSRHGRGEQKSFAEVVAERGITEAFRFYGRDAILAEHAQAFAKELSEGFAREIEAHGGDREKAARAVRSYYAGALAARAFDTSKRYDPVDVMIEDARETALVRVCELLRVTVRAMMSTCNVDAVFDAEEKRRAARMAEPTSYTLAKSEGIYTLTVYTRAGDVCDTRHLLSRRKEDAKIEAAAMIGPEFNSMSERKP